MSLLQYFAHFGVESTSNLCIANFLGFKRSRAEVKQTGQVDGDKYDVTDGVRGYRQRTLPDLVSNTTNVSTTLENLAGYSTSSAKPETFEAIAEIPRYIQTGIREET